MSCIRDRIVFRVIWTSPRIETGKLFSSHIPMRYNSSSIFLQSENQLHSFIQCVPGQERVLIKTLLTYPVSHFKLYITQFRKILHLIRNLNKHANKICFNNECSSNCKTEHFYSRNFVSTSNVYIYDVCLWRSIWIYCLFKPLSSTLQMSPQCCSKATRLVNQGSWVRSQTSQVWLRL